MFGKRPHELSKEDIERLISEGVQETAEIEFKESLPARKGEDPWITGGESIGDRARNEIIEEVIAFANAYGGTLVIGVSESKERPARAAAITTLPRCAELAERLRLQCRDCIEPQIPLLEVSGVATDDDGSGVVVFRVPRSRMAPHRHTITKECYIRRADRSEKMAMREIQDLTLQIDRGLSRVEARLKTQRDQFSEETRSFSSSTDPVFALRCTALPLTPLFIERVHRHDAVIPRMLEFSGKRGSNGHCKLQFPSTYGTWRPLLRGTQCVDIDESYSFCRSVYCDGVIEYALQRNQCPTHAIRIYPGWVFGIVANTLCAAERFRKAAAAPEVEFALELELVIINSDLPVSGYNGSDFGIFFGPIHQGQIIFPKYSVGPPHEFADLVALMERDFWNAAGDDSDAELRVDFSAAFAQLGLPWAD